jgi:hypothetical protein
VQPAQLPNISSPSPFFPATTVAAPIVFFAASLGAPAGYRVISAQAIFWRRATLIKRRFCSRHDGLSPTEFSLSISWGDDSLMAKPPTLDDLFFGT